MTRVPAFAVDAEPESLRAVRDHISAVLSDWPTPRRLDAMLLVDELAAARMGTGKEPIELRIVRRSDSAHVEARGGVPGVEIDPLTKRMFDALASDWSHTEEATSCRLIATSEAVPSVGDLTDDELFALLPDREARDELFSRYHDFAVRLAYRFRGQRAARLDVEQVASIGLVKSLERFDVSVGVKFTTYAGRTITGELKRHLRDATWSIRVPRGLKEASLHIRRIDAELSQKLGRHPTVEEVADAADLTVDEVIEALEAGNAYASTSLEAPFSDEDDDPGLRGTLGDVDPGLALAEHWHAVAPALEGLPERERQILFLRFYEDLTQREIAEKIGISQMHVSRLIRRALEHLRAEISDAAG